jgi:UDP-N-acetylmuramoyl-tripeptide--D-alanyl-D-alanine ligase
LNHLWSIEDMIAAMGARPAGRTPSGVTGVSIDTRTLRPGEAFFAIRGDRFDGHDFLVHAMKAGASLAVVNEDRLAALGATSLPLLVVRDVMEGLERLAVAARARSKAKVVAVTGSVGKTTTKEMLRVALSACGSVHASAASFNNHWGVPLSLSRLPPDARFAVFEIGMNHAGEIRELVKLVRPHVAIITAIAAAHLGAFENLQGIARAKAEIFEGVTPGGVALINRDDRHFKLLGDLAGAAGVTNIRSFGTKRGADFRATNIINQAGLCVVDALIDGEKATYKIGAPGNHIASNSLAVLGAASIIGADVARCALALSQFRAERGRGERHLLRHADGPITLIDESYNANPASMAAALALLGEADIQPRGRRIAVLGDMLELGEKSARLHAELEKPIRENRIDLVFLAGEHMKALAARIDPPLFAGHFATWQELDKALAGALKGGDAVMVKASNGLKFSGIIDSLLETYPATGAAAE